MAAAATAATKEAGPGSEPLKNALCITQNQGQAEGVTFQDNRFKKMIFSFYSNNKSLFVTRPL